MKKIMAINCIVLSMAGTSVFADSVTASTELSGDLSAASGEIVAGASDLIIGGANLLVTGIQAAGESVVVVLKPVGESTTASLEISADIAGNASLAVGESVQVVAELTGNALIAAGKTIAFIPNDVGKSLLHHSVHDDGDNS